VSAAIAAPRAARIPAARAAAVAWLTLAAIQRDVYSLTQARDVFCAHGAQPVEIIDAVDSLGPVHWLHLCNVFGINYSEAGHG